MEFDKDNPPEAVEFLGVTYRRMGGKRRYYLSTSTKNAERRKAKGLHVAIWEHANSALVPKGHEIHHKDGNTFNCSPENLECLPKAVHRSFSKPGMDMDKQRMHLDRVRDLTKAWHASPEGREWHRQNAIKNSRFQPGYRPEPLKVKGTRICTVCEREFIYRNVRNTICSTSCHDRKRRRRERACLQSDG